ncbi:MAG: DUF4421 family protein [Bdellovibrionales bacterium]
MSLSIFAWIGFFLLKSWGLEGASAENLDVQRKEGELKVELGIIVPRCEFDLIAPRGVSNATARFKPFNPSRTSISLGYRNLSAAISLPNPDPQSDVDRYGRTRSTDFLFRFFGRHTYEVFYQEYRGYYLENSAELDPAYASRSDKIRRSDIRTYNWGGTYYYSWHESDFSQAVAFDQIIPAPHSGWGASWFTSVSQSDVRASAPLIPTSAASQFGLYGLFEDLERTNLAAGLALGGLYTKAQFYLTSFFALGLGYQSFRANFGTLGRRRFDSGGSYSSVRLGLGYNGKTHVTGAQLIGDHVATSFADGEIRGASIELKLFYAYRFQDVKFRSLDRVLDRSKSR